MASSNLTYDITARWLFGQIGETQFNLHALGAGGRAGSTTPGAVHPDLANNMTQTYTPKKGKTPGGPLPCCQYAMSAHTTTRSGTAMKCVWLDPVNPGAMMGNRNGMLIHGPGPRGSDGCIVLTTEDRDKVWAAVKANPHSFISVVGAIGDFERLNTHHFA